MQEVTQHVQRCCIQHGDQLYGACTHVPECRSNACRVYEPAVSIEGVKWVHLAALLTEARGHAIHVEFLCLVVPLA